MIRIENKLESDRFILNSGMNYTPFHLVFNMEDALTALEKIAAKKAEPVSIRFKGRGMQPFKANLSVPAATAFCYSHFEHEKNKTPLGIYEATEGYDQFRQWNGEVQLHPNGTLDAIYNPDSQLKMRDALAQPNVQHAVKVSWDYKPLRFAVDYLCRFNCIGPVVELTRFSVPVGVKQEHIVVWEVRNF